MSTQTKDHYIEGMSKAQHTYGKCVNCGEQLSLTNCFSSIGGTGNFCSSCFTAIMGDRPAGMPNPATMPDPVNHPSHYTTGTIECIDAIEASMTVEEFRGYLKGCTVKYIWRYRHKGNAAQDLDKALWYLKRLRATFE